MNESQQRHPTFIHSSEETFAQILDYYGIEWEYEPRAFPLRWDDDGNVIEAFAPDFYLPGEDLYIELTTLRPKLLTAKNRKLRLFKALYPQINIKLLKRQDLRDLMVKYGLDREAAKIAGTNAQRQDS
jgi:hypothetical protein